MEDSQKEYKNTRYAFIKKASLGIISVLGMGFVGFNFMKSKPISAINFNTISEKEVNKIIINRHSIKEEPRKPKPPPKKNATESVGLINNTKQESF